MVDTIENICVFSNSITSSTSNLSEISNGSRGSQTSECGDIAHFISLITTPKYKSHNDFKIYYGKEKVINFNYILDYMKSSGFCKSINRLVNNKHDCVSFNITDVRFDVIEYLRVNGYINISCTAHTFNVMDILFELFHEYDTNPEFFSRNYEYINYFWIWIENEDPKLLVDYINPRCGSHLIHAILKCHNKKIRDEFFDLFFEKWEHFYPMQELPTTIIQNELVDGENVILILARNFMGDKLKMLFKRKCYSPSNYTWYQNYNLYNTSFTVPLIMFLLEENSWMRRTEDLKKFAEIITILLEYGKVNPNLKVIETGNNLQDYLTYYGYNYENSPVMNVFLSKTKIEKSTNIPINVYHYNFEE
jgi:hypothetical protein